MQHIMQIAFDFDDEKVRKIAEERVQKDMDGIIKDIVTDRIAPFERSVYSWMEKERNWKMVDNAVKEYVEDIIDSHKQIIIEMAAKQLCESYKRTKAWKEKTQEVTE